MKYIKTLTQLSGTLMLGLLLFATPPSAAANDTIDLFQLVLDSDAKEINRAINAGADINSKSRAGNTPLQLAAKIGDHQVVSTLLAHGAKVDVRNRVGATALMIAAKYGNSHVVSSLLEQGSDPTIRTHEGYTAANFALAYGHRKTFDMLQKAEKQF